MSDIAGRIRPAPPTLRYVVLRHEGVAEAHFDLMFETAAGSALATWRSAVWPIEEEVGLVKTGDHRREYLEYEGEVSGGRGHVVRVEAGFYGLKARGAGRWVLTFKDLAGRRQLEFVEEGGDRWVARVPRI